MGLFTRNSPPVTKTETPPATQEVNIENVASRVVEMLKPILAQPQPQAAPQVQQVEDNDDDTTPEERARITRVAGDVTKSLTGPYADIFNLTMPSYARSAAVNNLTEGQRIIYDKYKDEVDAGVDRACANNPTLKAVPMIHENAIKLVLGSHSDEIEQLVISRLTADQLPATFSMPNTTGGGAASEDAPTQSEQEWVGFFAPRSRQRDWDVNTMREFKSIKPGFLHEMVAEHKARKAAKEGTK